MIPYRQAKREFERAYWIAALARNGGRRDLTAMEAGVNRTWLFGRLRALGIPRLRTVKPDRFGELGL